MNRSTLRALSIWGGRMVCWVVVLCVATASSASDWTDDGNYYGSWSSDGIPGWNGTGVPDAPGAIAQLITPPLYYPETNQDNPAGVTVGTLQFGNNNDMGPYYWTIDVTNPIILNQDGQGVGLPARIINNNQNATDQNAFYFPTAGGSFVLNDDLFVSNPAGAFSQNPNGSIQFGVPLTGTGNVTFNSDGPISSTNRSSPGAIWLNQNSTFTVPVGGKILVQKGLVAVDNTGNVDPASFTPFGVKTNPITIGEAGAGDAALLARLNNAPIDYAVTIAPNNLGETRTFGAASNGNFTVSTQSVTLNGDLNLRAGTTSRGAYQQYTGNFSGAGKLTKTGPAVAVLSGANTYTSPTTIAEGTLVFENHASLYNGDNTKWNATKLIVQAGASLGFGIGNPGAGNFTDSEIVSFNNSFGSLSGGQLAFLALDPTVTSYTYANTITNTSGGTVAMGFKKVGPNTLVLTANNSYTGGTDIAGGTLNLGSAGAINNTGTISFSGGTLQHTAVNTTDYSPRFSNADNQAYSIDTNGQNVTYSGNLSSFGGTFIPA
jgi:autotransporter-associated beta strand protein